MDSRLYKELYEAYASVYTPREVEEFDEAITSEKGKAKAAEMISKRTTASGRAKSGQGDNVARIKHISRSNVDGYRGTPPNPKVAKNPVKSNFTGLNTGSGNKAAKRAAALKKEEVENVEELYKGKHGQTDKQYADSRSQGGKMVSGDSKMSGAEYTHGRRVKAANPGMQPDVGGKTKPKSQGKMDKGTRADLEYRKANLKTKKEELELTGLFTEEEIDAILEAYDKI